MLLAIDWFHCRCYWTGLVKWVEKSPLFKEAKVKKAYFGWWGILIENVFQWEWEWLKTSIRVCAKTDKWKFVFGFTEGQLKTSSGSSKYIVYPKCGSFTSHAFHINHLPKAACYPIVIVKSSPINLNSWRHYTQLFGWLISLFLFMWHVCARVWHANANCSHIQVQCSSSHVRAPTKR